MKKKNRLNFFLFITLIICIIVSILIFLFISNKKSNTTKEDGSTKYLLKSNAENIYALNNNDVLEFYSDDKLVNSFKCNGALCMTYEFLSDSEGYLLGDYFSIAVFCYDEGTDLDTCHSTTISYLMYNIKTGNVKKYDNVKQIFYPSDNKLHAFENNDGTFSVVSYDGKVDSKFENLRIWNHLIEEAYLSYDNDFVVTTVDNKWGVEKLLEKETIVEHKYDSLRLLDKYFDQYYSPDYYIGEIDGKSNLYYLKDSKPVTTQGYERIVTLDSNTLLVYNNKEFSFIDFNENKLTTDTIKVQGNLFPTKREYGFYVVANEEDSNVVDIYAGDDLLISYHYSYNLKTKTLVGNLDTNR